MDDFTLAIAHLLTVGVLGVTSAVAVETVRFAASTGVEPIEEVRVKEEIDTMDIKPGIVYTIPQFCDADECKAIITACENSQNFKRSKVGQGDVHTGRTSASCQLSSLGVGNYDAIVSRAARLFGVGPSQVEGLQVAKYQQGQEYKPHHDFFNNGDPKIDRTQQRMGTIVVYLNNDFDAGETSFPELGVTRKGENVGDALVWRNCDIVSPAAAGDKDEVLCYNNTLHAGTPPVSGVKYVLTIWLRFPPPPPPSVS